MILADVPVGILSPGLTPGVYGSDRGWAALTFPLLAGSAPRADDQLRDRAGAAADVGAVVAGHVSLTRSLEAAAIALWYGLRSRSFLLSGSPARRTTPPPRPPEADSGGCSCTTPISSMKLSISSSRVRAVSPVDVMATLFLAAGTSALAGRQHVRRGERAGWARAAWWSRVTSSPSA